MAAALPYALLGSGGLSAASLGMIHAGNHMEGDEGMSGGDKLQLVIAALGGLAMGGAHGLGRGRRLIIERDEAGNMRVSVPPVELKEKAEEVVAQRAAADAAEAVAAAAAAKGGGVVPDPWGVS